MTSNHNRIVTTRLALRQDSIEHWLSSDLLLFGGEPAISYEFDPDDGSKKAYRLKVGKKDPDGTLHTWRELPYLNVALSDVIGLSSYLSGTDLNTHYKLSSDDNITLHLMYSDDKDRPYSWHDTGDIFSVSSLTAHISSLRDDVDGLIDISAIQDERITTLESLVAAISSDYTTSALVSAIVEGYLAGWELSDYYKKTETSSSLELNAEFKKYLLSGDYATKADLSNSISSLSNTVDIKLSAYWKKSETSSANELNVKFNTLSSFSNEWKNAVDLSIAGISASVKNDYWKKNETSSASELSAEFKKYQLSGDFATKTELSNVRSDLSTYARETSAAAYGQASSYVNSSLSSYWKKTETSSASELSIKFSTLSSFSNEWKSNVDISVASLSSYAYLLDNSKVDKVTGIAGNLAQFKEDGNLESAGKKIADLLNRDDIISYPDDTSALVESQGIKSFVNSSIENMAAFYITKDAAGNPFTTYAELSSQVSGYNAGLPRIPTKNDYTIVLQDETRTTSLSVNPTTRYTFLGTYLSGGAWLFQYIVNNTALTQAQVDAINSEITKAKVLQIVKNKSDIASLSSTLSSSYYKKTETSSAMQLSNEFKKYLLSGDYASKTELSNARSDLSTYARETSAASYSAASAYVDNKLSGYWKKTETSSATELSIEFKKYLLSGEYACLSSLNEVSSKTDNKVKIGQYDNPLSAIAELSIINISEDDYLLLVAAGILNMSAVYIVSSDHLNAYDLTINNVAEPILSDDAATKAYVDNAVSEVDLSAYYKKSETSSASEISSEFKKYQLSGDYATKPEVSAISSFLSADTASKYVKLTSDTTQDLSTSIDMKGFLRVGGITVQGRKYVQITDHLIPPAQQSLTMVGQVYQMTKDDPANNYLHGHLYLLTVDISSNLAYEDITGLNEMSVAYTPETQDLQFYSHIGRAVYDEATEDLDLEILRM